MAWNTARAKRPYNEGEFVKKCLCDAVEILFSESNKLKRMIADVQLSRHTVGHRILDNNTVIDRGGVLEDVLEDVLDDTF